MTHSYMETEICYKTIGNGENLAVFLHGWGGGSELILPLALNLANVCNLTCLLIDFPPFKHSEIPKTTWTIENYAELTTEIIKKVLNQQKFNSINLIGHSFGGRVCILLASKQEIDISKVVLLASAGIKPKFNLKTKYKILKYKLCKRFGLKNAENMGSEDYKNLPATMKSTFNNIVNTDLTPLLEKINQKTLIIFGENDKETPIYMAKKLHKKIKNSKLLILQNAGHFVYLDKMPEVTYNISLFLNSL